MWRDLLPPVGPGTRWAIVVSGWLLVLTGFVVIVDQRVSDVEDAIVHADLRRERDTLLAWVSEFRKDIFTLDREIEELTRKNVAVPERYLRQRDDIKEELERAKQRLELLERDHPEVTSTPSGFRKVRLNWVFN